MRKTARIPLLTAALACGTVALVFLAQALSGPTRTELYADQEDLRLTIGKVGRETDFLLPSVQEQLANQQQVQQAAPVRFRSGEPYFVVRGFIEDRTGQPLAGRLTVGPTELTDDTGATHRAVHVAYSSLRSETSLNRIYDPAPQAQFDQFAQVQQRPPQLAASNSANIRSRVNVDQSTRFAFLPPELLAFAAFFRTLSPDVKSVNIHHTVVEAQVQQSEHIRFENLTTAGATPQTLAAGYNIAIENVEHGPFRHGFLNIIGPDAERKTHELRLSLRVVPTGQRGALPSSLTFTPPLVETDMGDRAVCQKIHESWGADSSVQPATTGAVDLSQKRETWQANLIDRNATHFTITTRLTAAGPPTKHEFVIRDIPVP